jgi:NADH:ubiquinone oxidoreductase subunit 6 (subunit J)
MTLEEILFGLFAAGACLGAVAVVLAQRVARMAFWLIVSLGSTAGLFFLLHADFVAATQLLVYVGGTVVLLIFGVMLTASGPYLKITTSPADMILAAGIGLLFLAMLYSTVAAVDWGDASAKVAQAADWNRPAATTPHSARDGYNPPAVGNTARPLGLSLLGLRPDKDLGASPDKPLSAGYLLPFEIVSVHLLVVLIGAAYLARAKRRAGED